MFLTDEARDADTQLSALRDLVTRVQPADVPLREAPRLFDTFAAIERLACAAKTLLADRAAESEAWKQQGYPSAAEHIAAKTGTTAETARRTLATSKRLGNLPHTETAVRRGALSREQTDLIAELRQECLRRKAAADPDPKATRDRIHKARKVRCHTDPEGAWNLSGRGPLDIGAEITASLDLVCEELFRQARAQGRTEPREAYLFDALQIVAGWAWDIHNGTTPTWNFNDGPADPTADQSDTASPATASSAGSAASEPDSSGHSGERVGNDTGSAGAVHRQDPKSSWPPRDHPPAATGRTDDTPRDPNSLRTSAANRDDVGPAGGDTSRGSDSPTTSAADHDVAAPATGTTRGGHDHHHDQGQSQNREQRQAVNKRIAGPKRQVLVQVSLAALGRGHVQAGERCEIPGQGPIAVDTAQRMLGDATIKLVTGATQDSVTTVTHLGRRLATDRLVPTPTQPDPPPLPAPPPSTGPRPQPRYLVLIHLNTAALPPPTSEDDHCNIPGTGPVSRAALQLLATDWVIDRLTNNSVDLTTLSYTGRGLNTAQLMATLWAQPLCSVQGCNRLRVEYDHRTPWAAIHETSLTNIDALCGHHHSLKTTDGWALIVGAGKRPMVSPGDPRHPANQPEPSASAPRDADDTGTDIPPADSVLVGAAP